MEVKIKMGELDITAGQGQEIEKLRVKWTAKDSVFCDLFEKRKYALQLYQTVHPEDTDVTEEDIGDVTINNVFTDQEYNDLGMTVRGKLLLMLECQSNWSVNIIVRLLLYLAHTWNEHIEATKQNRYGSKKLNLPRPELYLIFIGDRKNRPEWINLSDEFFEGNHDFLEVKVRVLYGEQGKKDIISQYVDFTKVYHEKVKQYGRTREAVLETIRVCKNQDVLREYLAEREKEVISIMMALFDQQRAVEQFGYDKKEEGKIETKKETALTLSEMGMPVDSIAKAVKEGVDTVQQWLSGMVTVKP